MMKSLSVILVASALVLAGCASSPRNSSSTDSSTAQSAPETRIASPVTVPSISAKKVVLTMTGPKEIIESKDWGKFKREWRETFAEHASEAGVAFSFADQPPSQANEDGTVLLVEVADYRIVGIGARIWFGIMTGNAFIDAKVRFISLRNSFAFGEQQYNTSSSAAGGVFAKVTPQQVDQIASKVFLELKSAK